MGATETLEERVVEGLHADGETIHTRGAKARQALALDGAGVELEGDLDHVLEGGAPAHLRAPRSCSRR